MYITGDHAASSVCRLLTNYLIMPDTQGLDTHNPIQEPSQAVQKGQISHPPIHWQIFFTRPTLRLLCNRFPETYHYPGRGRSNLLHLS